MVVTGMEYHNPYSYCTVKGVFENAAGKTEAVYHRPVCRSAWDQQKTLMWYDEIGLFKPAFIHEENGYRLYSYYQSTELEAILLLRDMNVPIRDIQEFMKNRSAGSYGGPASG